MTLAPFAGIAAAPAPTSTPTGTPTSTPSNTPNTPRTTTPTSARTSTPSTPTKSSAATHAASALPSTAATPTRRLAALSSIPGIDTESTIVDHLRALEPSPKTEPPADPVPANHPLTEKTRDEASGLSALAPSTAPTPFAAPPPVFDELGPTGVGPLDVARATAAAHGEASEPSLDVDVDVGVDAEPAPTASLPAAATGHPGAPVDDVDADLDVDLDDDPDFVPADAPPAAAPAAPWVPDPAAELARPDAPPPFDVDGPVDWNVGAATDRFNLEDILASEADSLVLGDASDVVQTFTISARPSSGRMMGIGEAPPPQPMQIFVGGDVARLLEPQVVLRRNANPPAAGALSPFEHFVLQNVDGTRTVLEVQEHMRLSEGDLRIVLALLLDKHLIELARPASQPPIELASVVDAPPPSMSSTDTVALEPMPATPSLLIALPDPPAPIIDVVEPPPPPSTFTSPFTPAFAPPVEPSFEPSFTAPPPPDPTEPEFAPPPPSTFTPAFAPPPSIFAPAFSPPPPSPAFAPVFSPPPPSPAFAAPAFPAPDFAPPPSSPGFSPPPSLSTMAAPPAFSSMPPPLSGPKILALPGQSLPGQTAPKSTASQEVRVASAGAGNAALRAGLLIAGDHSKAAAYHAQCIRELKNGTVERAHQLARQALTAAPDITLYRDTLAEWPAFVAAHRTPDDVRAKAQAVLAEEAGDFDKALVLLQQAVASNPKNASAWNRLAVLLAMRKNDIAGAVDAAQKAVELVPDDATYLSNFTKFAALAEQRGGLDQKKRGLWNRLLGK